jgi:hypothetical protein
MNTTQTLKPKPGNQHWGIYHPDREFAREVGDPIRTVVEAPTKLAAEKTAARLGFSDPWANPITAEQAKRQQELSRKRTRSIRV